MLVKYSIGWQKFLENCTKYFKRCYKKLMNDQDSILFFRFLNVISTSFGFQNMLMWYDILF